MCKKVVLAIVFLLVVPGMALSVEVYSDGERSLDLGFWGQAWYQWIEDGSASGNKDLNDFMVRRAYMGINGTITPMLDFSVNYAIDKAGKDAKANNDIQLRDAYLRAKLAGEALMVNAGRMWVPIGRTPSTKCLLSLDLDWTRGGLAGGAFFPSVAANRDDGVMLWGNVANDMLRYRLMIADGIDGPNNPDDKLRYAGQVSVSLFDPETGYFNPETYIGEKNVLSVLASFDMQDKLTSGDYRAWTAGVHYDQAIGGGAITADVAYTDIRHGTQSITYTNMSPGDNADIISAKAGYLFSIDLQPVIHYEMVSVDKEKDTAIYGVGVNYFIKGNANKLSLDVTQVDQEKEIGDIKDRIVLTAQMAVGF